MKKVGLFIATAVMLVLFAFSVSAETEGYYTYEVENGEATITDVDESISGEVTIPSKLGGYSVTSIGDEAFSYCSSLTSITIPDSVTSIGDYTFYDCDNLTSVTIGDSVTSIGGYAFSSCSSLTSITIPDSVTSIGDYVFANCSGLTSITIPDSVTNIGDFAFYCCRSLESITIPDSVTSIDGGAFCGCSSLRSITLGDSVTNIGSYAFEYCSSLTSITIPDSVTSIGGYAFSSCSSLTSITLGDSVTSIGSYAFSSCSSLTSITIPDSVTSIGSWAFSGCSSLTSITLPFVGSTLDGDGTSNTHFGYIFGADSYSYNYNYVPESLKEVVITAPCKSIGDGAFYRCSNLTSITIGNNVTNIGSYAFYNCPNLKYLKIPASFENTSYSTFDGIDNLEEIVISKGNGIMTSYDATTYKYTPWYKSNQSLKKLIIEDGVTNISNFAFYCCSSLTSVTIGNNVTNIGDCAFYNCSSLTSITIPDGVTSIGDWAFLSCSSLTSVTIPDSVTNIGKDTFYNCSSLTSVTIPDSVISIDHGAFEYCSSLTSITIPDSVASIGDQAFRGCSSLTSVTVPDSVTSIGNGAFEDCSGLTNVTIGNSVTSIGSSAFYKCTSLESVTISNKVASIGEVAFYNCSKLKDVYYTGTKSQWESITIGNWNSNLTNAAIHYTHKNIVDIPQQNPTCTKVGYTEGKQCSDCKEWLSGHETIAKLGHSYSSSYTTDKKATLSANGSKSKHCTRDGCTAKTSVTAIARVSSVTLSTTNYIYDGKNKTPTVTVKDANGKKLVKNTDYKLSVASKRSGIGRYTVKVTFMGNYSGSKSVYFYIKPGKTDSVKSAAQTVSSIKLSWSKVPGAAGYTVYRYSPAKKAYVNAGTTTGTSLTVKSLYAGTKYTFRVVAYGKTSGGKVYDSDSYALLKTATKTKTPILSDITAYKGKVKLFWTATSGETGYTIYYSTKKDSGFKKYANYESNSGYVTGLTSGKTYYFKVRTYIKTDSGYVYSDWSNIKGVKVK